MDVNRLREIVDENVQLMISKNQDYSGQSGDNITITGTLGVATRLMDKVHRLYNLLSHPENEINYESVSDTLMDICNYGLIGRMLEEGAWASLPKLVYLAGPIEGIPVEDARDWRESMATTLAEYGVSCFIPNGAYKVASVPAIAEQIVAIDRFAITQCDLLLANLSGPGRAFGTIREIEYARSLGKRVIVMAPDVTSAFAYDVEVVNTFKKAIDLIIGEHHDI